MILLFDSCTLSIISLKFELSLKEQIDWIELKDMTAKISHIQQQDGVAGETGR